MASKLKNMNKAILFIAMFGLVLGILARSCVEGLLKNVEEKKGSYFGRQFGEFNVLFIVLSFVLHGFVLTYHIEIGICG
ncbi:hypothetical protein Golob_005262 [Gossypium lobatum]|uniref:Uncharacterized protein n=1 Tax=Gossypium lobatum TaxID=34289 RepID=A0A7J8MSM1_9ROSI|nr:hypothetical protein [Gossypium lobatum]